MKSLCLDLSQGGKEYLMRAHFGLPSVEAEDKEGKPPISVKFEIPYFTTSGIQVCLPHTHIISLKPTGSSARVNFIINPEQEFEQPALFTCLFR